VITHPGEEKVLTIQAQEKKDQTLSIDVDLGMAKSFVEYEIIDGNKIEFTMTPSEFTKNKPYNIKIGLT